MLGFFRKTPPVKHVPTHRHNQTVLAALEKIMVDLAALTAAVTANTAAVADVTAVVNTLKSESDQPSIDALTTQITTNNAALEALKPVTPASS